MRINKMTTFLSGTFVFFLLSLAINVAGQSSDTPSNSETRLRSAIRKAVCEAPGLEPEDCAGDFRYVKKSFDLNGDGRMEEIVWVPENDWGGSSGYPIAILLHTNSGYRKLWSVDQAWTPIIALSSSSHGWHDIAFQFGGGGVRFYYQILKFDGTHYKYGSRQRTQPKGQTVIGKDFEMTTFGPIPKSS